MKKYILFLNGKYPKNHINFYKSLLSGKKIIAVDGGYNFFNQIKFKPHVLIGDFDSIKSPKKISAEIEIHKFPQKKDKTDFELALNFCFKNKVDVIEIVMPDYGEIDHLLGNVMLLNRGFKSGVKIKLINYKYEIYPVKNSKLTITGSVGDIVSVIPNSSNVKLSCSGMDYNVRNLSLSSTSSRALRNQIKNKRSVFEIKGAALVIHLISKR